MSEIIPVAPAAMPTVTYAPGSPYSIQQLTMDYGTPYIVNRNPATSAPYIPGRTLPYTPGMGETNPFVTSPRSVSPPTRPINAPATSAVGLGGAISAGAGVLAALPSFATAFQNIATGFGNIGAILSGNEENIQPYQSYNPYYDEIIRGVYDNNEKFLRDARGAWQQADAIPRNSPDFLGRGLQEAQRLACGILGIGCPATTPEGIPTNGSPGLTPPFRGGQSTGVSYWVDVYRDLYLKSNPGQPHRGYPDVYTVRAKGPIQGLRIVQGSTNQTLQLLHNGEPVYLGNTIDPTEEYGNSRILNIRREDGLPDTGGNPAFLPGAAPLPAPTPLLNGAPSPNRYPSNNPNHPANQNPANPVDPAIQPLDSPVNNPLVPGNPPGGIQPDDNGGFPPNLLKPLIPLLGLGLGAALLPGLLNGLRGIYNNRGTGTSGGNDPNPNSNNNLNCRFQEDTVSHTKLDFQYAFLQAMEATQTALLTKIDDKLGEKIPNGGISSFLKKFFNMFSLDRILNILTFVTVLHNAFMLSNAIGQTLFSAFDSVLQIFGAELKDADDNQISTGEFVGDAIENFFKALFGDQTVESVQVFWRNANRIYQAAMNIVYSLQSVMDSLTSSLELIGNYVAKIGNAMKKFGVVTEKAYGWMNPNHNFHQGKFWNFLNRTQEAAEVAENITSNALNITEEVSNIREQQTEFKESVDTIEAQLNATESANKTDSQSPSYSDADLIKPEE